MPSSSKKEVNSFGRSHSDDPNPFSNILVAHKRTEADRANRGLRFLIALSLLFSLQQSFRLSQATELTGGYGSHLSMTTTASTLPSPADIRRATSNASSPEKEYPRRTHVLEPN